MGPGPRGPGGRTTGRSSTSRLTPQLSAEESLAALVSRDVLCYVQMARPIVRHLRSDRLRTRGLRGLRSGWSLRSRTGLHGRPLTGPPRGFASPDPEGRALREMMASTYGLDIFCRAIEEGRASGAPRAIRPNGSVAANATGGAVPAAGRSHRIRGRGRRWPVLLRRCRKPRAGGLAGRMPDHLGNTAKRSVWHAIWVVSLVSDTADTEVRRIEGVVGAHLGRYNSRRLPRPRPPGDRAARKTLRVGGRP